MKMKSLYKIVFLVLTVIYMLGCKPDVPEIGEPFSKVEGIADEWILTEMRHADVDVNVGNVVSSIALPDEKYIGSNPATLTFNTSYSYSGDTGSSTLLFPTNGTWSFDDEDFPSELRVVDGSGDTYILQLLAPIRERVDNTLHFMFIRPFGDCAPDGASARGTVGYEYKFVRK